MSQLGQQLDGLTVQEIDRISNNKCCWSWAKEVLKKIWLNHGDLEILVKYHVRKRRDQC